MLQNFKAPTTIMKTFQKILTFGQQFIIKEEKETIN